MKKLIAVILLVAGWFSFLHLHKKRELRRIKAFRKHLKLTESFEQIQNLEYLSRLREGDL